MVRTVAAGGVRGQQTGAGVRVEAFVAALDHGERPAGSIQWNAVAMVLSNAGAPLTVTTPGGRERPARAASLLLAAAPGRLRAEGPADVLLGHLPDLDTDVRAPLLAAGHGPPAPTPPAPHPGNPSPRHLAAPAAPVSRRREARR
ncbi:hypothetical protein [Streptomyces achromogenes]|uniref:hypothetical protein n=1 Tax=Streptomyces achromogenes TaxID=67255 RepID=UPI003A80AFA0